MCFCIPCFPLHPVDKKKHRVIRECSLQKKQSICLEFDKSINGKTKKVTREKKYKISPWTKKLLNKSISENQNKL